MVRYRVMKKNGFSKQMDVVKRSLKPYLVIVSVNINLLIINKV